LSVCRQERFASEQIKILLINFAWLAWEGRGDFRRFAARAKNMVEDELATVYKGRKVGHKVRSVPFIISLGD
jgi:hypothetical protein